MKKVRNISAFALVALLAAGLYTSCERQSPMEPPSQAPAPTEPPSKLIPGDGDTELTAYKTAEGFWERRIEYDWTIVKTADPTSIDICSGASGMITYTLTATRTIVSESEVYGVRGEICVSNTGAAPTQDFGIWDEIWYEAGPGDYHLLFSGTIDVSDKPVLNPGESFCYPYEIIFTPIPGVRYKNIAYAIISNPNIPVSTGYIEFTLPETPTTTEIDAEADVTEVEYCPGGFTCTPSDPGPWHLYDSDVITFTKTVFNGSAMCDTYYDLDNEVTLEEIDTGQLRTDSATVSIYTCPCGYGCTLTIGYWKTHAGFHGNNPDRVTEHLPIWLGDAGGTKSIQVTTAAQAVEILSMDFGHASNGITKLYAQLLGAKLNISRGADDSAVASVIAEADAFLAMYDWQDWGSLSKSQRQVILGWMSTLDDYNNGDIGPGHCP